jgi:hypothetical protein
MSDRPQGPGWWQASDGNWYPPESHPAQQSPPPPERPTNGTQAPTAPFGGPPTGPGSPPASYLMPSAPPTGTPQWGAPYSPYGTPPGGGPYAVGGQTNGLAIASLVCSVAGVIPLFFGISCVVGIILGFVALGQIKRTGQQGRGLAIAGIAVGFALIAIFLLIITIAVTSAHNSN